MLSFNAAGTVPGICAAGAAPLHVKVLLASTSTPCPPMILMCMAADLHSLSSRAGFGGRLRGRHARAHGAGVLQGRRAAPSHWRDGVLGWVPAAQARAVWQPGACCTADAHRSRAHVCISFYMPVHRWHLPPPCDIVCRAHRGVLHACCTAHAGSVPCPAHPAPRYQAR